MTTIRPDGDGDVAAASTVEQTQLGSPYLRTPGFVTAVSAEFTSSDQLVRHTPFGYEAMVLEVWPGGPCDSKVARQMVVAIGAGIGPWTAPALDAQDSRSRLRLSVSARIDGYISLKRGPSPPSGGTQVMLAYGHFTVQVMQWRQFDGLRTIASPLQR